MPLLRFLGHSACEIREGETRVLIDPFLTGNPRAGASADELNPTAIILTHAHNDHMGDAIAIAQRTGALIVAIYELATYLEGKGLRTHGMSIGGGHQFPWGWVKLTPAWHGSTFADEHGQLVTLGTPAGVLLRLGDKVLYHAGDTGFFGDMMYIGKQNIDLALLPIGDNFTMGPDDALDAVKLLHPGQVVPIHYNTFPVIEQDGAAWAERVEAEAGISCSVLEPGDELVY